MIPTLKQFLDCAGGKGAAGRSGAGPYFGLAARRDAAPFFRRALSLGFS